MEIFPDTRFTGETPARTLPGPAEVRAMNEATGHIRARNFYRPPPVAIPSLGLLVKYGSDIKIGEAETQRMVYRRLQGRVPVPEVFAWAEDADQGFIYMQLVEGDTMMERWSSLSEGERLGVCAELKEMANEWRVLESPDPGRFIGNWGKRPLTDCLIEHKHDLEGPFEGPNAVTQFHKACDIDITTPTPIVFTHNDLVAPNIILSTGPDPKVQAVIDWAQSGWYPGYWEFSKARKINVPMDVMDSELQEEWRDKYLPLILDPVDNEEFFYPWVYFMITRGMGGR